MNIYFKPKMAMDGQRFMTKTQHYRKVTKPLLERKRRARMNLYLDELKDLIVDTMEAQGEHVAKWEKADILEMTVNYLKMQRHEHVRGGDVPQIDGGGGGGGVVHMEKFRAGYTQAAYDVSKVFATLPGLDLKFGTRLMQHLGCRLKDLKTSAAEVPATAQRDLNQHQMDFQQSMRDNGVKSPNVMDLRHSKNDEQLEKQEDVWRPW